MKRNVGKIKKRKKRRKRNAQILTRFFFFSTKLQLLYQSSEHYVLKADSTFHIIMSNGKIEEEKIIIFHLLVTPFPKTLFA